MKELSKKAKEKMRNIAKESQLPPVGFHFTKTEDIEDATHWIATFDEDWEGNEQVSVTPYQFYRLNFDMYEREHFIQDDKKIHSLAFLIHNGYFARLDNIERYHK